MRFDRDTIILFAKFLTLTILVYGSIWLFTGILEKFLSPWITIPMNFILNVIAIYSMNKVSKRELGNHFRMKKNKNNQEIINLYLNELIRMAKTQASKEMLTNSIDKLLTNLPQVLKIIEENDKGNTNIDYAHLIDQVNKLDPSSLTFLQDVKDLKKIIDETFK